MNFAKVTGYPYVIHPCGTSTIKSNGFYKSYENNLIFENSYLYILLLYIFLSN